MKLFTTEDFMGEAFILASTDELTKRKAQQIADRANALLAQRLSEDVLIFGLSIKQLDDMKRFAEVHGWEKKE